MASAVSVTSAESEGTRRASTKQTMRSDNDVIGEDLALPVLKYRSGPLNSNFGHHNMEWRDYLPKSCFCYEDRSKRPAAVVAI